MPLYDVDPWGGWEMCYKDTSGTRLSLLEMFKIKVQKCTKANIMLACRNKAEPNKMVVLAEAGREFVFRRTASDVKRSDLTIEFGTRWNGWPGLGFSPAEEYWFYGEEEPGICDTYSDPLGLGLQSRVLCWNTNGEYGERCGKTKFLGPNDGRDNWERLIF